MNLSHQEIKSGIRELWESVFHNSGGFIEEIFNTYFDERYVVYKEISGKIVSALLGIPYTFGYGKHKLRGLYLCKLATEERFRHQGLMSELLEEINERASEEFDFTFLIPASDLNADYYRRRGYFNSFFRLEERFTSMHDFKNDFMVSLSESDERIYDLKMKLFEQLVVRHYDEIQKEGNDEIIEFIKKQEKQPVSSTSLCHTGKDIEFILKERDTNGYHVFISKDTENKITGLAFVRKEEDIKRLKIPAIYVEDMCSYYVLLYQIKRYFQEYSMSVFVTSERYSLSVLTEEVYGAENPDGGDLDLLFGLLETQFDFTKLMEPAGMVKLLNYDRIIEYVASLHNEVHFKLKIRDSEYPLWLVKNGKVSCEERKKGVEDRSILNLTQKEVSELLLRKKDSSSLIMEAFGIPRLILEMKLLPG